MKLSTKCLPVVSAIAMMPWPALIAAEYTVTPAFNAKMTFDDNIFLTEPATFSRIDEFNPSIRAQRQTETGSIALTLGTNIQRYSAVESLDGENPYLNFNAGRQLERLEYDVAASYREDLARDNAATDSGVFGSEARVTSRKLSPSLTYRLTERDSLITSLTLDDSRYSTGEFSDNETISWMAGWQRAITERLTTGLSFGYVDYSSESPTFSSESESESLSLIVNYDISETLRMEASAGRRRQTTDSFMGQQTDSQTSYGAVYDISFSKAFSRAELIVALSRGLTPSALGGVDEQDSLNVSWAYAFSERLKFTLQGAYLESTPTNTPNSETREFMDISPTLSWELAESTSLSIGYQFRQQKQTALDAQSNAIMLGITHQWDNNRWSR